MPKSLLLIVCLLAICAPAAFAGVTVTSPANGASVSGTVAYAASATASSCSKGVATMGIYTAPGVLAYVSNGSTLKTSLTLSSGTYYTTVEEWDFCGGASTTPIKITVTSNGKSFTNLQHSGGWSGYGQRAPNYTDCSPSPCDNVTYSMTQNVKSPAMSGESTAYYLAGSGAYGDSLWN